MGDPRDDGHTAIRCAYGCGAAMSSRYAEGGSHYEWHRARGDERPDECDHEWERTETGPKRYDGGTDEYVVCIAGCGASHYVGPGSGVL